jgi:hypothetical protein
MSTGPTGDFQFIAPLLEILQPSGIGAWMQLLGLVIFALTMGLVTAALSAARRGGDGLSEMGEGK